MGYTQKMFHNKGGIIQKFKFLDMFGIEPKLFVNSQDKYRSNFGAVLTIALMGIVITAAWIYGNDMYYKKNPYVSFAEEFQVKPEHFRIKKDTMNFAVGLTASNKQHYFDESIYTVKIDQFVMRKFIDESGENKVTVEKNPLKSRVCREDDFGIAENYFKNLAWLDKLYCLDNYDSAFIEGDYGQDVFATISIDFFPCQNTTESSHCKPQEEIDEALRDNYYSTYVTDSLVDPKNFTSPFTNVGRNVYGVSSGDIFKQVDYLYRIVEINDNSGIVFDSFNKRKGIQFTTEKENMKLGKNKDGMFLRIQIRHEKVKKTVIQRTYLNMAEVLAKVGGILKVFMLFFMVLSGYVSQKLYRMDVVNNMFSFKYKTDNDSSSCYKQCRGVKETDDSKKPRELKFRSIFNLLTNRCQRKVVLDNKKLLEHADQKIIHYLNIQKILEKLMEIDKLKLVLFNQQQKQLFDYLPKPIISSDSVNGKLLFQQHKEPSAILGQDMRTVEEKQDDAVKAYKMLKKRRIKNPLDKKILQILEQTNFVNENSIDKSIYMLESEESQMEESVISPTRGQIKSARKISIPKRYSNQKISQNNINTDKNKLLCMKPIDSSIQEYDSSTNKDTIKDKITLATNKHKVTEDFDWYSNINLEHNYSQERILAPFSHRYPAAILNSPGNISQELKDLNSTQLQDSNIKFKQQEVVDYDHINISVREDNLNSSNDKGLNNIDSSKNDDKGKETDKNNGKSKFQQNHNKQLT